MIGSSSVVTSLYQIRQIERHDLDRHPAGLDPRDIEDLVNERQQMARVRIDAGKVPPLRRAQLAGYPLHRHGGIAKDRVQRRAQFVRHVGQELRFGRRRLLELECLAAKQLVLICQLGRGFADLPFQLLRRQS